MIHYKNLLSINLKEEQEKNRGKVNLKSPREHQREAHKRMNPIFNK